MSRLRCEKLIWVSVQNLQSGIFSSTPPARNLLSQAFTEF